MNPDPTQIGRYQVQSLLGRGGMGSVFLAFDPLLKRQVVIKVVHEKGASYDHALERFQREAEISAKLNHPNIITVHDVGSDPVAGPFIAMEYVKGLSLAAQIRQQGPLPVEQVLRLVTQVSRALHAAAAEGIVHRDVKPENILVSPEGRVKLTDFGIAKLGDSKLTTVGGVVGTPSYMAPELLRDAVATPATDCYAMAVSAFEAITGDLPFKGDSVASMLLHIVQDPPLIPPTHSQALAAVFYRAFEKQPERRYPDVNAFTGALIHAVPLSPSLRTKLLLMLAGEDVSLHGVSPSSTHPGMGLGTESGAPATAAVRTPTPVPPIPQPPVPPASAPPSPAPAPTRAAPSSPAAAAPIGLPSSSPWLATPAAPRPAPPPAPSDPGIRSRSAAPPPPPSSALPPPDASRARGAARPSGPARGLVLAGLLGTLTLGLVGTGAWVLKRRQATPAAAAAGVLVETDPPGATVSLDGVVVGQTPLHGLQPKPEGQVLKVEKAGYAPQEIQVRPGDGEVRLTLAAKAEAQDPAGKASPPPAAGSPGDTERLQQELRRLQESNAREEARLRQAGKAPPARPAPAPAGPSTAPAPAAPATTAPAPASPPVPVPVVLQDREARVLQQSAPAYPAQALGNPLYTLREQRVRLRVYVNENGVPLQVAVADGIGRAGFDEAAMAAARRSTFAPAVRNGRPAGAWLELVFTFRPPR